MSTALRSTVPLTVVRSTTTTKSKQTKKRRPQRRPRADAPAMLDTPIYFCVAFEDDGTPFIFSAESDRDELQCGGAGEHVIVESHIQFPYVKAPPVVVTVCNRRKGGAA